MVDILLDHLNWWFRILIWHIQGRKGSNLYLIMLGILIPLGLHLALPSLNWLLLLVIIYVVTIGIDALADTIDFFWNFLPVSFGVCLTMLGIVIYNLL